MISLAIIGSRNFENYILAKNILLEIINENDLIVNKIISGGAKGVDKIAEKFAEEFNIDIEVIKPDWKKYGRSAGLIRNSDIIKNSDFIIAFWNGKSKGTLDSINKAKKLNKELIIKLI